MAIVEMSKLSLIAMSYERDKILNALQATRAAEVCEHTLTENTHSFEMDAEGLREYLSAAERALNYLTAGVNNYRKENKIKPPPKEETVLTYSEFLAQAEKREKAEEIIAKITELEEEKKRLCAEVVAAERMINSVKPFSMLEEPFSYYTGTAHTSARIGLLQSSALAALEAAAAEEELFALSVLGESEGLSVVCAVFFKNFEGDRLLQSFGFTACPFKEGCGKNIYGQATADKNRAEEEIENNALALYRQEENLRALQIYCDYVAFELEKAETSEKLLATQSAILLQAYVPKKDESEVARAIEETTSAAYYDFSAPAEDEMPPTLYSNNKIVENFEAITDMYSAPSSREFDPNTVMGFFYSLFLGFIMGDIGYGLMMILCGGALYFKTRKYPTGLTHLAGVFAVGGFFAVLWGILFNSFFGLSMSFYKAALPPPLGVYWAFMGIDIPAVLVISVFLGISHLMAGYACQAYQCFKRRQISDGLFSGVVWAVFSLGVGIAVAGLIDDFNVPVLAMVGGITAGVSLLAAMLTAGRKEKIIGKFTKGFGAAYGVINYVSDILSYARLYGLMLSGVVIAQIISGFVITGYPIPEAGAAYTGFLFSGNAFLIILGILLLVVGHIFNFAIGLLGAYIHDARLQYVEFYGKFFEGEGRLFRPIGSVHNYVRLRK